MTMLAVVMVAMPLTGAAQALPPSVDLSSELPPIGDQGESKTEDMQCQWWAASYDMLTQYIKHFEHPEWDLTDPQHQFSPTFLVLAQPTCPPVDKLQAAGCVDMAEVPYNVNTHGVTQAQQEAAKPYRVTGLDTLWDYGAQIPPFSTSEQTIIKAKTYLASGHVLDVGIKASLTNFPNRYGTNATHYFDPIYTPGQELGVGHQVAFCGYNDNINPSGAGLDHRGGFLMVNQAGTNWNGEMHGFLWMSYAYAKQYVADCHAVTSIVSDTPLITRCDTYLGKVGDVITITGDSFGTCRRAAKVTFNGTSATNVTFDNNTITTLIPFGATSGPLVVYNWEGTPSNAKQLTIAPAVGLEVRMRVGDIVLKATGMAGKSLLFSTSTNLVNWVPWVLLSNPSGTVQLTDPAPSGARRFYRTEQR